MNSILTETDKKMINAMIKNIDKKKKKIPKDCKTSQKDWKRRHQYMTLLGEEILQVLDNIKISTGENIKNKEQLIDYAGRLFARNDSMAAEITFCIKQTREYRKHIYSEYECIIFTL